MTAAAQLDVAEAVALGAVDTALFGQFFFPKTCRQPAPPFHREMYRDLDDPNEPFVSFMIARDFAKTTVARLTLAKRAAYAISRTNLIVGKSEGAAMKTLSWLRNQVDHNALFAQTFGLVRGSKWSDQHIEIVNTIENVRINIVAAGILGSIRGINLDDYRPDFILVDDPCDEDNTATPEQRLKTSERFFGSLQNSLAPKIDCPWRKMALLQTVLNADDLVSMTQRDPQWKCHVYSCFDEHGQSRWPERYPTEELRAAKAGFINRGQAALWYREKECRIVSRETSSFMPEWYLTWDMYPTSGHTVIAVDPTPPPKNGVSTNIKNHKLDDACVGAVRAEGPTAYVLETYETKSPQVEELTGKILEMALRWRARKIVVETHMYQRALAEALRKRMQEERLFFIVEEIEDKRHKRLRIEQVISPIASLRQLRFPPNHPVLRDQFVAYPDVNHDDILDMISLALMALYRHLRAGASSEHERSGETIEGEFAVLGDDRLTSEFRSCP